MCKLYKDNPVLHQNDSLCAHTQTSTHTHTQARTHTHTTGVVLCSQPHLWGSSTRVLRVNGAAALLRVPAALLLSQKRRAASLEP